MNEEYSLYETNEEIINAGNYCFPFTLRLSNDLYGSIEEGKPGFSGNIKYKLIV